MTAPRNPQPADLPPLADGSGRLAAALAEQQRRIAASFGRFGRAAVSDVHDARVAARRLRSLLKTFRPLLDARRARLYRIDLRSFARALGGVREADVRRELLESLGRRESSVTAAEFLRLRKVLEAHDVASREALRRRLAEPGWAALCRALERHGASDRLLVRRDADLRRLLDLVEESWHQAVRLIGEEPGTPAELHELRLALKHCRYALEAVSDVSPKAAARLLRRLRAAQDVIGDHRDTLLAGHWVQSNQRSLGRVLTRRLAGLLERQEESLRRKAVARSGKVLPAYRDWRKSARRA